MEIYRDKDKARQAVELWRLNCDTVGFVPTMGALHEGHMSLVRHAVSECDRSAVSIFLNPAQFGENEDIKKYPRTPEADIELLRAEEVDLVFLPGVSDMYPENYSTWVVQEGLTDKLCGACRPGHFRGVCTVVTKLFNLIRADRAYFGRKDFQQSVIIRRMAADLDMPVEVRVMPVVREKDGLALSSRNRYLGREDRCRAVCLYEALTAVRDMFRGGETDPAALSEMLRERLRREGPVVRTEYCEIVAPDTLDTPREAAADSVAAVAAFIGQTRLIDNMPLGGILDDEFI